MKKTSTTIRTKTRTIHQKLSLTARMCMTRSLLGPLCGPEPRNGPQCGPYEKPSYAVVDRTTTRPPPTSRTMTGEPTSRKPLSLTTEKINESVPVALGNSADPPGLSGVTARPTEPTGGQVDLGAGTMPPLAAVAAPPPAVAVSTRRLKYGILGRNRLSQAERSAEQIRPAVTNAKPCLSAVIVPGSLGKKCEPPAGSPPTNVRTKPITIIKTPPTTINPLCGKTKISKAIIARPPRIRTISHQVA